MMSSQSADSSTTPHKRPRISSPGTLASAEAGNAGTNNGSGVKDMGIQNWNRVEEDSSNEEQSQTYASMIWAAGKLGMAYYDVDTMHIYMMSDVVETEDFSILKKIMQQIRPTQVITSAKQDETLLNCLKHKGGQDQSDQEESDREYVQLLPSSDFSFVISKQRVLSVNLPTIPAHFTDAERNLHISSLVPFENVNMVRALGGLLKFLEKMRIGVELEEASVRVPVLALSTFSLNEMVLVDNNSYSALQIFKQEFHPSVYKSGSASGSKEGLSLYGVMNRCKSQIGSKLLRSWFLRPLCDLNKLKKRQDAIAFFLQSRNLEATRSFQACLRHVKNVSRILAKMTQAQASISDWKVLYKTSYNAICIRDVCRAQATTQVQVFENIERTFTEDLYRIASLINNIVDFEESAVQNRFVVKPNVDPELDEKKRTYNGLPHLMTQVAKEELKRLSEDISQCNVIYLPQLGYLLAIPQSENMRTQEDFNIPGLDFVFQSNNIVHYRSASTKELDRRLGDTQCEITDHETTIMHRLQNSILEMSASLHDVMKYASELDCLISLAICAREYNYVRPGLATEPIIKIKGGRHPLQELCCSPFVPNDTISGPEAGKVKIITGPNASGKSVYLKQVGLIVFMTHIGSFVPAESAVIGMTDKIFTRIRTVDSVSVGLSTFMVDLNQVSASVNHATGKSLVILDEFGKGTDTIDGLSLLCAVLREWLQKEQACPHVLVSTHFHCINQPGLLPASSQLCFQTMEVMRDEEKLVFLYQLIEGSSDSSYSCHIATLAGLPKEIVSRSKEVTELLNQNKSVYRVDSASTDEMYKRCSAVVSAFMELDLDICDVSAFLKDVVLPISNFSKSKLKSK